LTKLSHLFKTNTKPYLYEDGHYLYGTEKTMSFFKYVMSGNWRNTWYLYQQSKGTVEVEVHDARELERE